MAKNKVQFIKVKNPKKEFLCALCSAPRQMRYSKNLNQKHYFQILLTSAFVSWALFPFMGFHSLFSVFFIWMSFEIINKFLYRKDISCPYCGFDATWYKRDVKLARKKVEEFWKKKEQKAPDTSILDSGGAAEA